MPAVANRIWQWLAATEHRGLLVLWSESYARSLVGPHGPWRGFASATVEDWLQLLADAQPPELRDTPQALAERTLVLAVLRACPARPSRHRRSATDHLSSPACNRRNGVDASRRIPARSVAQTVDVLVRVNISPSHVLGLDFPPATPSEYAIDAHCPKALTPSASHSSFFAPDRATKASSPCPRPPSAGSDAVIPLPLSATGCLTSDGGPLRHESRDGGKRRSRPASRHERNPGHRSSPRRRRAPRFRALIRSVARSARCSARQKSRSVRQVRKLR